jgi:hypothetical protein
MNNMNLCNEYFSIASTLEPDSKLLKEIRQMVASTPKAAQAEKTEVNQEQLAKIERLSRMYKF